MARPQRLDVPGVPQHIVQRGNNRQACFLNDDDRHAYLEMLDDALHMSACTLHAYVLMGNHVHLLVTPSAAGAIGRMMQKLGRRYVGRFNHHHQRTGTLWEGRYKACVVNSDRYVLACQRYIDLNPVRAGIVTDATDYPWSSCAHHCGLRFDARIVAHPTFVALGDTRHARASAYRRMLQEAHPDAELTIIRRHLQRQSTLGIKPKMGSGSRSNGHRADAQFSPATRD